MFENLTKLRNQQPAAFWALVVLVVVVIAGGLWSRSLVVWPSCSPCSRSERSSMTSMST